MVVAAPAIDVVTCLAEHQQNLQPQPAPLSALLVGLPEPALIGWLLAREGPAAAQLARLRHERLQRLSARLGGGDGPLPLLDLQTDPRCLPELLAEAGALAETLILAGGRDQPGLARELEGRWPGAVERVEDQPGLADLPALADRLLTAARPGSLAAGVAVATADADPAPAANLVLVAVAEDEAPGPLVAQFAAPGRLVVPFARDTGAGLGPWRGVVPTEAAFGTPTGEALRQTWAAAWTAAGWPEAVREAVLGGDPELASRLPPPTGPGPREQQARVLVVTGLDGSGKSTQAARLREHLVRAGHGAVVRKIYRQGAFLRLADELGARTRRGAPLAAFRVSRGVKLLDSLRAHRDVIAPALGACDVVVFDRYLETHVAAAGSQLGLDVADHPLLAPFPRADHAFWLRLETGAAHDRLLARGERRSADEHRLGLQGYARWFEALAAGANHTVLEAAQPVDPLAARIARVADSILPPPARGPHAAGHLSPDPVAAAAEVPRAEPCRLRVCSGAGPVLGADLVALAAHLTRCAPGAPARLSAGFWMEQYVAEVVRDLRCRPEAEARLPLAPAALALLPGLADLPMLAELDRILAAVGRVVAWAPAAEDPDAQRLAALFCPGGPAPVARFLARHDAALGVLAQNRGWPRA